MSENTSEGLSEKVRVSRDRGVATVTLNRPERLNALDGEAIDAFHDELAALADDPSVRAVVLTGAGRGFCAGGDVKALAAADQLAHRLDLRTTMETSELLAGMPKPTIAAVNGACAGAGLSFACACDLRYAARSAVFVTAFLGVGSPGDHGSSWVLTRAVGPAKARELMMLGERVDAEEAARIGLVHGVLDDTDLRAHVDGIAHRLADAPPLALAAMKANLNDATTIALHEYIDRETARFAERLGSDESRAAAQAFLDRRG